MSNDQENIKKIQEKKVHPDALNSLVHQICSEMLTLKKQLTDLEEEVKLNELRRDDEIRDVFDNIKIYKANNPNIKEVIEIEDVDSRTGKILSSKEAVTHLGRALLGDNNEKEKE